MEIKILLFITIFLNIFSFIHLFYKKNEIIIDKLNSYTICNNNKCKYINNDDKNSQLKYINEPILTSTNNKKFLSDNNFELSDTKYAFITNYISYISIINYGQKLNETLILTAKNLPANSYISEYKLILGKLNISNMQISVSNGGKYSYIRVPENTILFNFQLKNGESLTINLMYEKYNTDYFDYYRNDYFSIPKFAYDALGEMHINLPSNFILLDNNNNELKNVENNNDNNIYYWNGNVPKEGFTVKFKLTITKGRFKVKTYQEILSSSNYIKNVEITSPKYFVGGNLDIIEYNVETNEGNEINSTYIQMNDDNIIFKFKDVSDDKFYYQISGIFESNVYNKYNEKLIKEEYYKLNDENVKEVFENLANKILNNYYNQHNNNDQNETEYKILAKWVNEYLEYDINLLGIEYTPDEILMNKRGVCHHFTILLNTLLNSINIPAISVVGIVHNGNRYDTNYEQHEWSLVYYNNKWIPVDSTHGIYNGILPISFIYQGYNKLEILMNGQLDEIDFGENIDSGEYIENY